MIAKLLGLLLVGLALLLASPLHAAWQSAVNGSMLGKRMPALALQRAAGQMPDQAAPGGAGRGVLLVDFWAPWCVSCRESVPRLNELQREFGPRGLQVIGVAREPPADLAQFTRRVPLAYPVGCDPGGTLFKAMGLRSLPYAVLVDRNGIVVWQGDPARLSRDTVEATLAAPALGALMQM